MQKPRTINADISRENFGSTVAAIQGDGNIRSISVQLQNNGVDWLPPAGVRAEVVYAKPDGTIGMYDKLADGTPAVSVSGSMATVCLASQMLAIPGKVKVSIAFSNPQLDKVTTFPFTVTVAEDIFAEAQESEDYIKLQWLEDKLAELKESGAFDGPKGDAFTYDDFTPEQLAALVGPQGPQGPAGDNTAAVEAAAAANSAADNANAAAAAAQDVMAAVMLDITQLKSGLTDEQAAREASENAMRADLAVNANANAETRRKLDYLWKLNQGISYQFETNDTAAYVKTIPSGAKMASVQQIGGKTIILSQKINVRGNEVTENGITFTNSSGIVTVKGEATDVATSRTLYIENPYFEAGHKYLFLGCPKGGARGKYMIDTGAGIGSDTGEGKISTCTQTGYFYFTIYVYPDAGAVDLVFKPQLYDLTEIFGAGSEPATVEAFHAIFPEDYYPYNAGVLVSADIACVMYNDTVIADIPTAVRALSGYGWNAGDVYNSIERTESGWQYVQRVGSRAYQDGDIDTDGVTTYYALDNPVITDITDLMAEFPACFEVEAGGTLTFASDAKLPVPSTEKYLIALAEVG